MHIKIKIKYVIVLKFNFEQHSTIFIYNKYIYRILKKMKKYLLFMKKLKITY